MNIPENALVIFAPVFRPGQAKPRLSPIFTPEEACEIQAAFLGDIAERAARAAPAGTAVSVAWSEPPVAASSPIGTLPPGVAVEIQQGKDPGERMALAIQTKLRAGHRRAVILRAGAPTLPADHVASAFEALRRAEVVVGPLSSGGCYLVGMSRLHLEIFLRVDWGAADVLKIARKRIKESGAPFAEIGPWHDVETPEDLGRLWKDLLHMREKRTGDLPQRTWHLLARLAPGRIPK